MKNALSHIPWALPPWPRREEEKPAEMVDRLTQSETFRKEQNVKNPLDGTRLWENS